MTYHPKIIKEYGKQLYKFLTENKNRTVFVSEMSDHLKTNHSVTLDTLNHLKGQHLVKQGINGWMVI